MNRTALVDTIFTKRSFLCVGLDTEISKIPPHLAMLPDGILQFNKAIIDATRDLCVAYKPNLAFYEALGPLGWQILKETIDYIGQDHLIIADAKRGDIGNTSRMYASAFFEQMGCSAITIAPYMGSDSVTPFLGFEGKWAIVLALTSNEGSADFQLTEQAASGGMRLFEKVIQQVNTWGTPENIMYVVGATHPELFARVRELAPDHFLLVPGVGAQGGDLAAVCQWGLNSDCGLLINASRSIIYASQQENFAEKARDAAKEMQEAMAKILDERGW